jgi:hypothetical protein
MSASRKTIFDLERRNDIVSDFRFTVEDLEKTNVTTKSLGKMSLLKLLNDCIKTWPYRQGANSIPSYASAKGFDIFDIDEETDILYNYELFLNLLHWVPSYDVVSKNYIPFLDNSTVKEECNRCIENIEYKLEMVNMRVREITTEETPQYVISKRDADVDAVIESVPELSEALLSYLDVRNRNDENAKKSVLKAIADYLEQKRKDKCYHGTEYNRLCENLFAVFNNASIRHKNSKQWKLKKPERMKLYDQTFKAAIHLMQMEDVKAFNDRVDELKRM